MSDCYQEGTTAFHPTQETCPILGRLLLNVKKKRFNSIFLTAKEIVAELYRVLHYPRIQKRAQRLQRHYGTQVIIWIGPTFLWMTPYAVL